jgi:hypothetical protein
MKQLFKYPSIVVIGEKQDVALFLKEQFFRISGRWGMLAVVSGISDSMMELIYYQQLCLLDRSYERTIVGKIHKQLVTLDFDSKYVTNNFIFLHGFEIEAGIVYNYGDNLSIAFDADCFNQNEFWHEFLCRSYPNLTFKYKTVELKEQILHFHTGTVPDPGDRYVYEEDYPENTILTDFDLV